MKSSFSDLVITTRSIHQILVLTAVALIITSLLSKTPPNIIAAQEELAKIENLTSEKVWNPLFIEEFFQKDDGVIIGYGDNISHFQVWNIEFQQDELTPNNVSTGHKHSIIITAPTDVFVGWDYTYILWQGAEPYITVPKTIGTLGQIWEKSRDLNVLTVESLKKYAYVQRAPDLPVEKVDIAVLDTQSFYSRDEAGSQGEWGVFRSDIFPSDAIAPEDRMSYGLGYIIEGNYFFGHKWKIWIPAITLKGQMLSFLGDKPIDATMLLCEKAGVQKNECSDSFEQVFPNLYMTAKDYWDVPLNNVGNYLQSQQESQLQDFNFLGFTIPARLINSLGAFLLLFLQFYLGLHLHAMNKTEIRENLPAWIGTFPDWISRSFALISISFFPLLSIFAMNIKTPMVNPSWINVPRYVLYGSEIISIFIITEFIFLWRSLYKTKAFSRSGSKRKNTRVMKKRLPILSDKPRMKK